MRPLRRARAAAFDPAALPGYVAGEAGRVLTTTVGGLAWERPEAAGEVPTKQTLIALGDSLTYGDQVGGPANAWPAALAALRGWTLTANAGINGSSVALGGGTPLVQRWADAVPEGYAGHVTLMIGTNDWANGLPLGAPGAETPGTVYGALLVTARGILARGAAVTLHLITPPWRGEEPARRGNPAYTLEQVRQAARDVAAQVAREFPGQVQLVDAGEGLRDFLEGGGYLGADLLHFNAAGHGLLARYLAAHLSGAGQTAAPDPVSPQGYARVLSTLTPGNLGGQDGWTVHGGVVVVGADGLSISAPFDSQPRGALHALGGATTVAMRWLAPATSGQGVILHAFHRLSDDQAICTWSISGTLDCGIIQGGLVTSWIGGLGPAVPADAWVELRRANGLIELRLWDAAGGTRPPEPLFTHADVDLVGDAFGFTTIGAPARTIKAVSAS